jgi:hypothetical protein
MTIETIKPRITSIRYYTSAPRKQPKVGDLRETKKHGKQVRVFRMAHGPGGRVIGYDCTGGRQNYDWVSYDEARKRGLDRLLPKDAQ